MLSIFNKMCHAEGYFICKSRERFNKIIEKNLTDPDSFRQVFLGVGIYDYGGNFYHKISQADGNYFIEDYTERASITDIIRQAKIKLRSLFLS